MSYVACSKGFLRVHQVSSHLENQHFQIKIQPGYREPTWKPGDEASHPILNISSGSLFVAQTD